MNFWTYCPTCMTRTNHTVKGGTPCCDGCHNPNPLCSIRPTMLEAAEKSLDKERKNARTNAD